MNGFMQGSRGGASRVASFLFVLVVWQVIVFTGIAPARYFPNLTKIGAGAWAMLMNGELPQAELLTMGRAFFGLIVAASIGIFLALLSDAIPVFGRGFAVIAALLQPVPPAAIIPVAIFALGLGMKLYMFIIVIVAIWPPYLNGVAALRSVPTEQILTGRMMGLSALALLFRIKLPAALPEIFAGIRYAAALSLIAVIVSEMLAGQNGIGHLLVQKSFSMRIPEVFAIMFVAMIDGVVMSAAVNLTRRGFTGWHMRQREAQR